MFTWMTAFCIGVIILYLSGFLLPWYAYILCLFVVLCIPHSTLRQTSFVLAFFVILGHSYAAYEAKKHIDSILPPEFENMPLEITGYFCSLPRESLHNKSAEFCVSSVKSPASGRLSLDYTRLHLRWSKKKPFHLSDSRLSYRLNVKLKRPRGTLNPIGGSYEQYLFHKRIAATGIITSLVSSEPMSTDKKISIRRVAEQNLVFARRGISEYLDSQLVDLEHKGLIKALLLGDRSEISKVDNDLLSHTGTQHLMAISGLHVGVMLMLLYQLLPKSRCSVMIISLLGLTYILLVGFSASAQRALVMCLIAIIYIMGFQPPSLWRPFITGLTVVLLLDPLSPLGMGFWYSFVSVGLLLLFAFIGPKKATAWKLFLIVQCVLLVGLTPINAYFGLPHSASNSLANLVAIPWVSIVVLPGALISLFVSIVFPTLSLTLFLIINEILHVIMSFLSSLQSVSVQLKADSSLVLNIALLVVLAFSVAFLRLKPLLMCFVISLVLYFYLPSNLKDKNNQLVVFDAGQGLAIAVHAGGGVWLYDIGAAYEKTSVAQRAILPYLRSHNLIDSTQGLIVSHGDWDHAGGLADLLSVLNVENFWSGEVDRLIVSGGQKAKPCIESMSWYSETVSVEVLYPLKVPLDHKVKSSNNHSCVVRVSLQGFSFLLMGDLESEAELEFVRYYKSKLKSDVLIAGHHGSKNASSYALLKHVQPEYVVFSAGYGNRFGHPHKKVVERAKKYTEKIFNTAQAGALTFDVASTNHTNTSGLVITVKGMRESEMPFWILK